MTTIKTVSVDIRRSEMTTIRVVVPAWELPILQALHGRTGTQVVGEGSKEYDALPNVEAEFERLSARYGRERREDGSLGMPLAEAVFGQFQPGLLNLERNIEAAKVSAGG
jgi:hypothetical protein